MQIGVVGARLADAGRGRGAHGVLLADGRAVPGRTARREVARAGVVAEFSAIRTGVDSGVIGAAQVDLFARAAKDLGPDLRQHLDDPELVAAAGSEPVDVLARRLRRTVELIRGDDGLADSESKREASTWRSWIDHRTGMGHVHGEFDPERFEAICGAVDRQVSRLANKGGVSKTHGLAAQAVFELLTGRASVGSGAPHIGVLVDWETFTNGGHADSVRETEGGVSVPPETVARLACDAVVQRIVCDERGVPVNVGRRYRTATAAQWLAMRAIYRTCAWHGCDRPLSWCQLCDVAVGNSRRSPKATHHHIHEWEHGGATDLCNLVPLCSEHHHAVHEGGWSLRLHDDRLLDIVAPDGGLHVSTVPDRRPDRAPPEPPGWSPVRGRRSRRLVAAVRGGGRE